MSKPIIQTQVPSGYIDLGTGIPSLDLLPMEMIESAAERYFSAGDRSTLQYGAEQGNGLFIATLADFLTSNFEFSVTEEKLLATTGASSALDLLCSLFTQPGDTVIVEEPTYFLALGIFADHHLKVHAVSLDKDGLDVDELEEILPEVKPKFVYTIPSFQNPASTIMSTKRREKLVSLAQENDFIVIADEVYHLLAYYRKLPRPLAVYADQVEQVVSINSFSKILAPGLRLGWIQAHPQMISRLVGCGLMESGGGLNPFTSAIVYYLIESGDLVENIRKLHNKYRLRLEAMSSALDRYLPEVEYLKPQGGYYFWVRILRQDTAQLRKLIRKEKVDFRPGNFFSSQNAMNEYIRLSISYHDPEQIERGIQLLSLSLREH